MFKHFFVLLLLSLLAACGGGDSDVVRPDTREPLMRRYVGPTIVVRAHGDSTQAGAHTGDVDGPSVAQGIFDTRGDNITMINRGSGGMTSEVRLYGGYVMHGVRLHPPWAEVLATEPATVITFKLGINDAKHLTHERFRENMNTLIDMTEAAGFQVVLETPSPTDVIDMPRLQERIEHNVDILRNIAAARPSVRFCNHWGYGLQHGFENRDGIHPTAHAYEEWIGPKLATCILNAVN